MQVFEWQGLTYSTCEVKIVIRRHEGEMTYETRSSLDHVMARILEAWQTRLSKAFAIFASAGPRTDNHLAHQSSAFQEVPNRAADHSPPS
jgi:hypothetical protein